MAATDAEKRTMFCRIEGNHLVPSHSSDAEMLAMMDRSKDVEVTIKQRRSLPAMRRYWAILSECVAAMDDARWPTAEKLHDALKLATGYVETFHTLDGLAVIRADSIAFSRMDNAEFRGFQARAFRVINEKFGFDPEALGTDLKQAGAS